MRRPRIPRFSVRLVIYLAVIALILLARGPLHLGELGRRAARQLVPPPTAADTTVTVAGTDLAPDLLRDVTARYRRAYPGVDIRLTGGGTYGALEDLVAGRADVAVLARAPFAREQTILRRLDGDTASCYPIALGALLLVASQRSELRAVDVDELRAFLRGQGPPAGAPGAEPGATAAFDRIYAPPEDSGWWDALLVALGSPPEGPAWPVRPVFVTDGAAVLAAVAADPRAIGLVGSLAEPDVCERAGLRCLAVAPAAGAEPVAISPAALGSGAYPLWQHLVVCIRDGAGIEAAKLVTHLGSARGQREIERTGNLPARRVAREVILTREPIGGRGPAGKDVSP